MNSRYLLVLRTGFLFCDIPLHSGFRNSTKASHIVAPTPKARQSRLKPRKLFPKLVGRESFELSRQMRGSQSRVRSNEHLNVVGHNFQSVNLGVQFLRLSVQELPKSFLHGPYKYRLSILGTPHKVILEREDRACTDSIAGIHHEPSVEQWLDIRK